MSQASKPASLRVRLSMVFKMNSWCKTQSELLSKAQSCLNPLSILTADMCNVHGLEQLWPVLDSTKRRCMHLKVAAHHSGAIIYVRNMMHTSTAQKV